MKRFLLQGLKFLLTTVALYLTAFFALTHVRFLGKQVIYRTNDYYQWKGGVAVPKFQEWDAGERYDAVVIGSSHAYRGYDPRVFESRGHRMFNLGSSAQTPLSTFAILEEYVTKDRTSVVIFDLYENAFDQDGIESVSDLTQNMSSDRAALRLACSLRDIRGMNMFTLRMMNKNGPSMWADPSYKGAGFAIRADSARPDVSYPAFRELRIEERQIERFVDCLDLCYERGLQVVLCSHPSPQKGERARHAAFSRIVDSVLATRPAGQDIRRFDLAESPGYDDHDHFCDHTHLNESGARLFTGQLLDSLVVNRVLPER